MIIYKITNILNNKVYIGQTVNTLAYRKSQHVREVSYVNRKKTYLYNAMIKHGVENFVFEEIDKADTIEELNLKESFWINSFKSTEKEFGYNLDTGGKNCLKSESTKRKIGDTTIEKWKNEETSAKMRAGAIKGLNTFYENCRNKRVECICPVCGSLRIRPLWEAKKYRFCSNKCAGKIVGIKGVMAARDKLMRENIEYKKEISIFILQWVLENKELVLSCPYNKITTTLIPLLNEIRMKYEIIDFRTLFLCFNVSSRKEFLKYLKDYISK